MTHDRFEHVTRLRELLQAGKPLVEVTMVAVRGSAPQVQGARALVTQSGLDFGTVGGGKVEAAAIAHALAMLETKQAAPTIETWNLQTDIGMTCGGEVKLLFDPYLTRRWNVAVFGAGHVSQALVRLLMTLECQITVIDARGEWVEQLPTRRNVTPVCVDSPEQLVADFPDDTFFVLMSKGHATDLPVLAEVLRSRRPPYIGVIGSRQKAAVLKRDLKTLGLSSEQIESFHCPMGLPLGNNTPPEIALSIAAQLVSVRDAPS